jgi:AraC-like DNA-binding protein
MRSSVVAATVHFAVSHGVSMEQITANTGLRSEDLFDVGDRLPDHIVANVWQLIDAIRPGEAIPLKMASAVPDTYFGVLAHVWRYSEDPQNVLNLFVRFHKTLADRLHLEVSQGSNETSVHFSHPSDSIDGGCGAEVGAAATASFGRKYFGGDALLRVQFAAAAHGPLKLYKDFFGVPIEFETGRTELTFRTDLLASSIGKIDSDLSDSLVQYLEEVSAVLRNEAEPSFLKGIRKAIEENARSADYSIQGLADRLQLSVRSIQRKAKKRNIRLIDMVNEARMAHAMKLLSSQKLNLEEVSFLLGYSEVRAFARAFKRQSGQTPSDFRRSVR